MSTAALAVGLQYSVSSSYIACSWRPRMVWDWGGWHWDWGTIPGGTFLGKLSSGQCHLDLWNKCQLKGDDYTAEPGWRHGLMQISPCSGSPTSSRLSEYPMKQVQAWFLEWGEPWLHPPLWSQSFCPWSSWLLSLRDLLYSSAAEKGILPLQSRKEYTLSFKHPNLFNNSITLQRPLSKKTLPLPLFPI